METNFKVGDIVIYKPNGLTFRCENNKMWKWMMESGNYIKAPKKDQNLLSDDEMMIVCAAAT